MPVRALLPALFLVLLSFPASAHGINLFATTEGSAVHGFAYDSGGRRLANATVALEAPDGTALDRTTTAEDGTFRFATERPGAYRLKLSTTDGHGADFKVTVGTPPSKSADMETDARIAAAVARAVEPLQEQLAAHDASVRWHDVLGGVGYIFGLFGVASYVAARRREKARS